jgi:hypothetical protein
MGRLNFGVFRPDKRSSVPLGRGDTGTTVGAVVSVFFQHYPFTLWSLSS